MSKAAAQLFSEDSPAPKARPRQARGAKKAAAAPAERIILQYGGCEWDAAALKEKVIASYTAGGHRWGRVKSLTMYIKPEERKVYYVLNDKITGSVDFDA